MVTDRWTTEIDEITRQFKQSFGSLDAEQLNWKPDTVHWSIAQILQHLVVVNYSYKPIFTAIEGGTYKTPFLGKFNFTTNFFGKMILNSVKPDTKRKMKTLAIWEPDKSNIPLSILDDFENSQEWLKNVIRGSSDRIDQGLVISSPANRNIVYKLETAFDVIVNHEKRHYLQAISVLQAQRSK